METEKPPKSPQHGLPKNRDKGYDESHGYDVGHGGPTSPGDAPAKKVPPPQKQKSSDPCE